MLPEEADSILQSRKTIASLQSAKQACAEVGSMSMVVHLENEIRLVGKLVHAHIIAPMTVRRVGGALEEISC